MGKSLATISILPSISHNLLKMLCLLPNNKNYMLLLLITCKLLGIGTYVTTRVQKGYR